MTDFNLGKSVILASPDTGLKQGEMACVEDGQETLFPQTSLLKALVNLTQIDIPSAPRMQDTEEENVMACGLEEDTLHM